ncbi:MAG: acyl-CoA thioesterase [Proteobacteria bacterium]|nr:acyl-CoA thioesterase [Pseudomonadota bacterium]
MVIKPSKYPEPEASRKPRGELMVRTLAMPADTNPAGDIFGGWVLSQMDIAGGIAASMRARGRVATVAIDAMTFHRPVTVGDVVCCYADFKRVGRTSLTIAIEAWAIQHADQTHMLVTEGTFTYVAIDDDRRPRPVPAA